MVRFVESQYLSKEYQKQFWASNKNARGFDHPVVEFFARQRIEYIRRHIDLASVRSAFDVGCGDGFATHDFAEIVPRVEGGDISELMLEHDPIDRGSLRVIDAAEPGSAARLLPGWCTRGRFCTTSKTRLGRCGRWDAWSGRYVVIFEPKSGELAAVPGFGLPQSTGARRVCAVSKAYLEALARQAGLEMVACDYCGRIPPNKTPRWLFEMVRRLPFQAGRIGGISVALIARKVDRPQ